MVGKDGSCKALMPEKLEIFSISLVFGRIFKFILVRIHVSSITLHFLHILITHPLDAFIFDKIVVQVQFLQ